MKSKSLVSINVYYAPKSFGGATIIAEEINQILSKEYSWYITVITTIQNSEYVPYHIKKYKTKNVNVIAINIPNTIGYEEIYNNQKISDIIFSTLKVIKPSILHIHSIQTLGATFIKELRTLPVKIVATIHDCWWICERQFMINNNGNYCFQKIIDPLVCMYCVDDITRYEKRQRYLEDTKNYIDLYLFPSEFHKKLHIDNNFDSAKCKTNKNGVKFPESNFKKSKSKSIRFGFTGGPGKIKGLDLIEKAFKEIELPNYELWLVDGAKNLGKSWGHALRNISVPGKVRVIDPYTQDTIDDFFKNIDVLLFPSQWKESFGLTVREALIRNVWVISTNGGGTTEDLRDNVNSYIIPISNDISEFKNAILKCFDKDWNNYKNPHQSDITDYQSQSEELNSYFTELLET